MLIPVNRSTILVQKCIIIIIIIMYFIKLCQNAESTIFKSM